MQDTHHDTIYKTELSHWWYRVRRVMVANLIRAYFPDRTDIKILDVGCGTGGLLKELAPFGKVTGVDVSPRAIAFCNERGFTDVSLGSATDIPFPDGTFDLVLALDVIEHIEDDRKALAEINRVLKPGGTVFVFVPAFLFLWGINDIRSQHYRRYTKAELSAKATEAGFTPLRLTYFNTFLFPPIAFLRILVRKLGIKVESDVELGNAFVNAIFYRIFLLESFFLKYMNFPFGVSAMVIGRKC